MVDPGKVGTHPLGVGRNQEKINPESSHNASEADRGFRLYRGWPSTERKMGMGMQLLIGMIRQSLGFARKEPFARRENRCSELHSLSLAQSYG